MINDTQLVKMNLTASIWHGLASVWRHDNCGELCDQQKLCAHSRMYIENVLFLLISKAVRQHQFNRNIDYDKNTVWFSVTRPTCKQKLGLLFKLSIYIIPTKRKSFTGWYQHSHLVVVQISVCFFPISTPSLCSFLQVPFLVARYSFVKHSIFSVCFSREPSWTLDVHWLYRFWDTSALVCQRQLKEFFLEKRCADLPLDDDK